MIRSGIRCWLGVCYDFNMRVGRVSMILELNYYFPFILKLVIESAGYKKIGV